MTTASVTDLSAYCLDVARRAKTASRALVSLSTEAKNRWLIACANRLEQSSDDILSANERDLSHAESYGLTTAAIDRLRLTNDRIRGIAKSLRELAVLPDPIGEVIEGSTRPNGLRVSKVRSPLGVLFFIYESRPNVTADAAGIAVKSGNAIILRGGKEAFYSSQAIIDVMQSTCASCGIPADAIQLVNTTDREAVGHFLKHSDWIDLAIPRGGESLVRRVAAEATMPVLKHYDGNCHIYIDEFADLELAVRVIENAKCQRMGVCNALESLVVHRSVLKDVLPRLASTLGQHAIEIRGDEEVCNVLSNAVAATSEDWGTEYLGPTLSIRVVGSIDEAIEHINRYGSHHTDGIITKDIHASERFCTLVDSAAVVVNASTRFNDGGELGMGAEIGISTDKFHARGPCGLRELTTYKYIIHGDGHIRG